MREANDPDSRIERLLIELSPLRHERLAEEPIIEIGEWTPVSCRERGRDTPGLADSHRDRRHADRGESFRCRGEAAADNREIRRTLHHETPIRNRIGTS